MDQLVRIGKKRTILISISVLLVSIHTIYFYHSIRPGIEMSKLIQQLIRFLLTILLLYMTYKGKNWAKNLSIILFSLAGLIAIISLFSLNTILINRIPIIVMAFVYSVAVYHFGFSKSFKKFHQYQNNMS